MIIYECARCGEDAGRGGQIVDYRMYCRRCYEDEFGVGTGSRNESETNPRSRVSGGKGDDGRRTQQRPANSITNSIGMEFVYIAPGNFMMGSPEDEPGRCDDEVLHEVTLTKGYYMQATPVTQGQWKAVMGAGNNPSFFKGDDLPVESISWNDAKDFIDNLNRRESMDKYRLPTEAEWEYVACAGTNTPFNTGRCLSTENANYDGNYPLNGCPMGEYRERTTPVKMFPPNAWGFHDMHGNVMEWCADWYGRYPTSAVTDPTGPLSGASRVLRGGSWKSDAWRCRSASRIWFGPGFRDDFFGFRLARHPGQPSGR